MRTGKWQGELQGQRKNGESYPEWLTVTAVKKNDERVTHYIITYSDISERRKAEKAIEEIGVLRPADPFTQSQTADRPSVSGDHNRATQADFWRLVIHQP